MLMETECSAEPTGNRFARVFKGRTDILVLWAWNGCDEVKLIERAKENVKVRIRRLAHHSRLLQSSGTVSTCRSTVARTLARAGVLFRSGGNEINLMYNLQSLLGRAPVGTKVA